MPDDQTEPGEAAQPQEQPESESLDDLLAQATAHYAQKDYKTAAELYSRATELQAEVNGEMSTQNADLLYLYGRCLYHVAVGKSDVLGSKVAGEKTQPDQQRASAAAAEGLGERSNGTSAGAQQRASEEVVAAMATDAEEGQKPSDPSASTSKPYFQFTGDENFDDSDEEEADEEGGGGKEQGAAAEEEDDDFSNAFEILDLARVLLQRKLEEVENDNSAGDGKCKQTGGSSETIRQLKERLADTHDLQAEISLEGEQFRSAVNDLRAALALKEQLHAPDSSLIAEIHYKLSLALEFSSVTQQKGEDGATDPSSVAHVDEAMREEAAQQMEAAINSCKLRIAKEEKALASGTANGTNGRSQITKKSIDDVRDMVQDMEQRVSTSRASQFLFTDDSRARRTPAASSLDQ